MLKKTLLCAALLLPLHAHAEEAKKSFSAGDLNWTVLANWTIPAKPLDIAQTLDFKKVFILAADAKVYIYAADGKPLGALPVDAHVTAIDIAPRGEMLYLLNDKTNSYTALDISFTQKIDITGAPVRGKVDAPVTLVLFSDFECPWCGKLEPELAKLLAANPDKLRIVFKHLPLPMHKLAEPAALAAIAAQRQDKFWEMHDCLFGTSNWNEGSVDECARKVGLNMEKFKADMASPEVGMQLNKDRSDSMAAEVNSTPTLFINGKPTRDKSLANLQRMVNEAAAGAK